MKKRFLTIALCIAMIMTCVRTQVFSSGTISVVVNGVNVAFDDDIGYPFAENGRTMVPLRAACEAYGAQVGYDGESMTALVSKDGIDVKVPINGDIIYRNGIKVKNDAPAKVVNSRTYLPIRVVMEALGAQVSWDGDSSTVIIADPDYLFIEDVLKNGKTDYRWSGAEWDDWNEAMSHMNSGSYAGAIEKFRTVATAFSSRPNDIGLLFMYMARCYGKLGQYHEASVCYSAASEYLAQVPGEEEQALRYSIYAEEVDGYVDAYYKTNDEEYKMSRFFGVLYEPENGTVIGATSEAPVVTRFPKITGIDHGAYLHYFDYGDDVSKLDDRFKAAADAGKILEIGLQPRGGLYQVKADDYLVGLAQYLEKQHCPILLRFANEMNLPSCEWYDEDGAAYIEAFRTVANVMRKYAPSVALVWAPNFYPGDRVDKYYPGDEYVDYVGASIYGGYSSSSDPLDEGVDRSNLVTLIDRIYNTYGDRKPIIIAEGGWNYWDDSMTDFVAWQFKDYYTYLPILYPNIKMVFHFDMGHPVLSQSPQLLEAYKYGVGGSPRYLSDYRASTDVNYCGLFSGITLPAEEVSVCAYVHSPRRDWDYVEYTVGTQTVSATDKPYEATLDLSGFAGQSVQLTVRAMRYDGSVCEENTYKINV